MSTMLEYSPELPPLAEGSVGADGRVRPVTGAGTPRLSRGSRTERCTVCGLYFPTTSAGDAHRTGTHGVRTGPDRRRCLTEDEMRALVRKDGTPQWRIDARGRWTNSKPRPEALHSAF